MQGSGGRGSKAGARAGGWGTSGGELAERLQWHCPPWAGWSISLVTGLRARGYVMESQSFQCKLQLLLLLPLMPVTHSRDWARNPEGRFSSCSPRLGTGRARRRRKGICGALYLLPAWPGEGAPRFASFLRGDLRTAGSIRSHWALAIDYKNKKIDTGRLCLRLSDSISEVVLVCECVYRWLFFFFLSFSFLSLSPLVPPLLS